VRSSAGGLCVQTWLLRIAIAAAIGVAYFLAAQLSNSFLITPETVIFWPAAGISSPSRGAVVDGAIACPGRRSDRHRRGQSFATFWHCNHSCLGRR
jgi:hypothetical protein